MDATNISHRNDYSATEILCADDSSVNLKLLSAILRNCGYGVTCVCDGEEALEAIRQQPERFSVLITDHDMPNMTGLTLIAEVRKLKFKGKIIMNSATVTEKELSTQGDGSVVILIGKPVNPAKLLKAVHGKN